MSRFAAAVLSAVCLAFFSLSTAAAGQDAHRLRIGFTHFAPFVFVDDDGKLTGIDVELADAACRKLGCTTQFVPVNWHQKEAILAHGDVDCLWAGFSIDVRENLYQWTAPYLKSRQVVMVPQMSPVRRQEDLKGLLVATTHDSKAENLLLSQKCLPFSVEVYSFAFIDEAFTCLAEGYADAAASHESVLDYFAKHSPRAWRLLPENLAVVNVGVAFDHRADPAFVRRLSDTLAGFREDGTLLSILKKYDYVEPDDRSI